MAEVPVLRFVIESTGDELVLEGADIPKPPITWGATLIKSSSRYPGGEAMVQIHGEELEPIELEGVIDDQWYGTPGHALQMRRLIDGFTAAGELVRFEYADDRLWGIFEAEVREFTRERVEYTITFEPYWRARPDLLLFFDYLAAPVDNNARIRSKLDELAALVGPGGTLSNLLDDLVDTSTLDAVALDILSAQNKHSLVATTLDGIVDYADVSRELAAQVVRSARGSARALSRASSRIRSTSVATYTAEGVALLRAGRFVDAVESRVTLARKDVIDMIRTFLARVAPVGRRIHTVAEGDTLFRLAARYYGAPDLWTKIADANSLETTTITPGDRLVIPRLRR